MAAPETIALLSAKVQTYEPFISTTGIKLTAQDISFALAKVSKESAALMEAKYLNWLPSTIKIIDHLYEWVLKKHWKAPENSDPTDFFRDFAQAVIFEQTSPHTCQTCYGRAKAMIGSKVTECTNCRGTGRKNPSDNSRANKLRVSWSSYRWTWKNRYNLAISYVDSLENDAIEMIKSL